MDHAGDLVDVAGGVDVLEPGIAVGVHPALIACQMILRMLFLPIGREAIPAGGWSIAIPGPLVPTIGPETRYRRLAGAGHQHLHRGVIREDRLSSQHMPPDGIGERFQQCCGFAEPIAQDTVAETSPPVAVELHLRGGRSLWRAPIGWSSLIVS